MNKLISRFLTFPFKDETRRQVVPSLPVGLLALAVLLPATFITVNAFCIYADLAASVLFSVKGVVPTLLCSFGLLTTAIAATLSTAGSYLLVGACYVLLTTPKQGK